jgi:hypothetical protein
VTDETREARPAKRANRIVRKIYQEGTVKLGDDIRVRRVLANFVFRCLFCLHPNKLPHVSTSDYSTSLFCR